MQTSAHDNLSTFDIERRLTELGRRHRAMGETILRHIPMPDFYEVARKVVRRRFEAGDYDAQYRRAWERFAAVVPCSVREERASEEVVEALARDLAEILDGAYDDWCLEVAK